MNFSGSVRKLLNRKPEYTLEEIVLNDEANKIILSEADTNFQLINFLSRKDNFDKLVGYFLTPDEDKDFNMEYLYELADKVMISTEKKYSERISERKDFLAHIFSPLMNRIDPNESPNSIQRLLKVALNYSRVMIPNVITLFMPMLGKEVEEKEKENECDLENKKVDKLTERIREEEPNESKCDGAIISEEDDKRVVDENNICRDESDKKSDDNSGGDADADMVSVEDTKENEGGNEGAKGSEFVDVFVHNLCVRPNIFADFFVDFINVLVDNKFLFNENDFFGALCSKFLELSEDGYDNEELIEQIANFIIDVVGGLKRMNFTNEPHDMKYNDSLTAKLLSYALNTDKHSNSSSPSPKRVLCFKIVSSLLPSFDFKESPSVLLAVLPFLSSFADVIHKGSNQPAQVAHPSSVDYAAEEKEIEEAEKIGDSGENGVNAEDDSNMAVEDSSEDIEHKDVFVLSQGPVEPFGTFRLEALGVVEKVITSDCDAVWEFVVGTDSILNALVSVFYKYKWNTLLHASVYNILKVIISSDSPHAESVRELLFGKYMFLERLAASEEMAEAEVKSGAVRFDYFAFNTKLFGLVNESKSRFVKDAFNKTFAKDGVHNATLLGLKKRSKDESVSLDRMRHKPSKKTFDAFDIYFNRSSLSCFISSTHGDGFDDVEDDDDDDEDYHDEGQRVSTYHPIDIFSDSNDDDFYSTKMDTEEDRNDDESNNPNSPSEKDHSDGDSNDNDEGNGTGDSSGNGDDDNDEDYAMLPPEKKMKT